MQRRKLDFMTFDQLRDDTITLSKAPYHRLGKWSLAQVTDHIAISIEMSLNGFTAKVPFLFRVFGKPVKWITIRRRSIPSGVKAPTELMPPDGRADSAGVERLLNAIERYQACAKPLHPSPLFGKLTRAEWDQIHLIHAAHHFSFLVPKQGH